MQLVLATRPNQLALAQLRQHAPLHPSNCFLSLAILRCRALLADDDRPTTSKLVTIIYSDVLQLAYSKVGQNNIKKNQKEKKKKKRN